MRRCGRRRRRDLFSTIVCALVTSCSGPGAPGVGDKGTGDDLLHESPGSGGALSGSGGAAGGAGASSGAGSAQATGGSLSGGATSGGAPSRGGANQDQALPYLIGADITITLEDEYWGATYTDQGDTKSVEAILKAHGFNAIRVSTFVDPAAADGYAYTKPEAFRDLNHTVALAQRVKAQGMYFLLDFHLSDTWTDPAHQQKPQAWSALDQKALESQVYSYVKSSLETLKAAGALPDLVQVGNEITSGLLWDNGAISGSAFSGAAALLRQGLLAVHDVDSKILRVLHIEKCNNLSTTRWWLDGILAAGVEFEVLGQSCYAQAIIDGQQHHPGYQGTPDQWATTFGALALAYPELKFLIAEYSADPQGANQVMLDLADKRGLGTFNWDPTRFYETHPNVPLFDTTDSWNHYSVNSTRMSVMEQVAQNAKTQGR